MSDANRMDGRLPPLEDGAEESVAEATARLADVVALLEKWGRQPQLLREVVALKGRLEKLLATMSAYKPDSEGKDG